MPIPTDAQTFATLSAMIAPALFLTANGSLIISTSNRMSRIVDRIRAMNDLADQIDRGVIGLDYSDERLGHVVEQLAHLEWRSDHVRLALTFLYMSLSAFAGTSLALGAVVLVKSRMSEAPSLLAVAGVVLMLAAAVNLTREARRALRSNRQEVQFFRDLQARRKADRAATGPSPADPTGAGPAAPRGV